MNNTAIFKWTSSVQLFFQKLFAKQTNKKKEVQLIMIFFFRGGGGVFLGQGSVCIFIDHRHFSPPSLSPSLSGLTSIVVICIFSLRERSRCRASLPKATACWCLWTPSDVF